MHEQHDSIPQWARLLKMNWPACGWLYSEQDAENAASELRLFFGRNPPDNEELCRVIRWMSGPDGKQDKAPSLRELIRAICIHRKTVSAFPAHPTGQCAACNRGWAEVSPDPALPDYKSAVPCLCAKGQALMGLPDYARLSEEQLARVEDLRRLAGRQFAERTGVAYRNPYGVDVDAGEEF